MWLGRAITVILITTVQLKIVILAGEIIMYAPRHLYGINFK